MISPGWEEAVFLWLEPGAVHKKSRTASRDLHADHSRQSGYLCSRPV